jgi:recombination protein RecR
MKTLDDLVGLLVQLPGIGRKSAQRLAYYLLSSDDFYIDKLIQQITLLRTEIIECLVCGCYSDLSLCPFCEGGQRDRRVLCLVERAQDARNIEASGVFNGLFHVLGGLLSPLDGVGPDELRLESLWKRLESMPVDEIILAFSLTVEGDATALYIQKCLAQYNIKITRLAGGMPMGSSVEYVDKSSLVRSLEGRTELKS